MLTSVVQEGLAGRDAAVIYSRPLPEAKQNSNMFVCQGATTYIHGNTISTSVDSVC